MRTDEKKFFNYEWWKGRAITIFQRNYFVSSMKQICYIYLPKCESRKNIQLTDIWNVIIFEEDPILIIRDSCIISFLSDLLKLLLSYFQKCVIWDTNNKYEQQYICFMKEIFALKALRIHHRCFFIMCDQENEVI